MTVINPATSHSIIATYSYQSDATTSTDEGSPLFYTIRVSSEKIAATFGDTANAAPTVTGPFTGASVRGRRYVRRFGAIARAVIISRILGEAPIQFRIYREIPILDPTVFAEINADLNQTVSFAGETDWTIVSIYGEILR